MADPTSTVAINYEVDIDRRDFVIKDAEALVKGGHVSLDETTGEIEFSGENSHVPCGFVLGATTGIDSDLTGDSGGTKKAVVRGDIIRDVTVVGVTGITDIGSDVFATDGQTYDLANPGTLVAAGVVVGHVSGTTASVYFYSYVSAKLKE